MQERKSLILYIYQRKEVWKPKSRHWVANGRRKNEVPRLNHEVPLNIPFILRYKLNIENIYKFFESRNLRSKCSQIKWNASGCEKLKVVCKPSSYKVFLGSRLDRDKN